MLRPANLAVVIHFKNFLGSRWAAVSLDGSIASTLDKSVIKANFVEKAIFPWTLVTSEFARSLRSNPGSNMQGASV